MLKLELPLNTSSGFLFVFFNCNIEHFRLSIFAKFLAQHSHKILHPIYHKVTLHQHKNHWPSVTLANEWKGFLVYYFLVFEYIQFQLRVSDASVTYLYVSL